ncbi:hypothetical protein G7054_g7875 [Neopestalotiopsis clavispora]|nr:hypothetical protein G7054_g7875 [Neopestalotiopsis clavispora]
MDGYYQPYLPGGVGPGEETSPSSQEGHYIHNSQMQMESGEMPMVNPYETLGYVTGFPDPIMFQPPKPQNSRSRRKSAPGVDHVKHRRTRSGCYTCRSRRVKCDETHPICERCRKGKRECVYPEASTGKGPSDGSVKEGGLTESPGQSPGDAEDEAERDTKLEPIIDEEEPDDDYPRIDPSYRRASAASTSTLPKQSARYGSETPSGGGSSSPSLSTGTSVGFMAPFRASDPSIQPGPLDWSHLPAELRFYLDYYCENITHYNYGLSVDPEDFFRNFLPGTAVRQGNDALLYAVVGFAAYHHTVRNPRGQIQDFLKYYNKSVTLLLASFRKKEKQNTATLLTILQLATIEEYLGDWVSLMGHQKAVLQIMTTLFTPSTVMQSYVTRTLFAWYVRFDVFVGMLGGFETRLPRDWFSTALDFFEGQVAREPGDYSLKLELYSAAMNLITMDMSLLFAKGGRGELSPELFAAEHRILEDRLRDWKASLDSDQELCNADYLVTEFENRQPLTDDDIVDPYARKFLYKNQYFATTILLCEWRSILVMHKTQEALAVQQEPAQELRDLAYDVCQIFETVERWPSSPNGAIVILQSALVIATLYLPQDEKHQTWMRRKFATIESMGYVFPLTMRTRFAEIFQDQACVHWWLPNDEGLSPVIRNIRAFADERSANPGNEQTESLREMTAVFAKMGLHSRDESSSPSEPSPTRKGKNVML